MATPDTSKHDPQRLEDALVAKTFVKNGILDKDTVNKAILEHKRLSNDGIVLPLYDILLKQRSVDPDKARRALYTIKTNFVFCPACGRRSAITGLSIGARIACQCGQNLTVPAPPSEDPLIGMTLGGCVVQRKVGEGGMGAVYLAIHQLLQRPVAIKTLPPDMVEAPGVVERFQQEARAAAKLDHPNICQVHDVGSIEGTHYIILQFIDGETLAKRVKRDGPLPVKEAVRVIKDAAKGLAAAHRVGIVHRDIKPDNLMLTQDGDVKVADFGLARDVESDSQLSQSGQILGTPYYMAPEQSDGRQVDARTDIYSLGITLYFLLSGEKPFEGESPIQIIMKHMTGTYRPLEEAARGVPASLARVCAKMMQADPAKRYLNCAELTEDLQKVELELKGVTTGPISAPPTKRETELLARKGTPPPPGDKPRGGTSAAVPKKTPDTAARSKPASAPAPVVVSVIASEADTPGTAEMAAVPAPLPVWKKHAKPIAIGAAVLLLLIVIVAANRGGGGEPTPTEGSSAPSSGGSESESPVSAITKFDAFREKYTALGNHYADRNKMLTDESRRPWVRDDADVAAWFRQTGFPQLKQEATDEFAKVSKEIADLFKAHTPVKALPAIDDGLKRFYLDEHLTWLRDRSLAAALVLRDGARALSVYADLFASPPQGVDPAVDYGEKLVALLLETGKFEELRRVCNDIETARPDYGRRPPAWLREGQLVGGFFQRNPDYESLEEMERRHLGDFARSREAAVVYVLARLAQHGAKHSLAVHCYNRRLEEADPASAFRKLRPESMYWHARALDEARGFEALERNKIISLLKQGLAWGMTGDEKKLAEAWLRDLEGGRDTPRPTPTPSGSATPSPSATPAAATAEKRAAELGELASGLLDGADRLGGNAGSIHRLAAVQAMLLVILDPEPSAADVMERIAAATASFAKQTGLPPDASAAQHNAQFAAAAPVYNPLLREQAALILDRIEAVMKQRRGRGAKVPDTVEQEIRAARDRAAGAAQYDKAPYTLIQGAADQIAMTALALVAANPREERRDGRDDRQVIRALADRYIDGTIVGGTPLERSVSALAIAHAALVQRLGDLLPADAAPLTAGGSDGIFARLAEIDTAPAQFAAVTAELTRLCAAIARAGAAPLADDQDGG